MAPKKRKTSLDEEVPRQRQRVSDRFFRYETLVHTNEEQNAIDVVVHLLYESQQQIVIEEHNSEQIQHGLLLLLAGWIAVILEDGYDGVGKVIEEDFAKNNEESEEAIPIVRIRQMIDSLVTQGYDVWLDISMHDGLIPLAAVTNLLMNDHVNQPVQESMNVLRKLMQFHETLPKEFSVYYTNKQVLPIDMNVRVAKSRVRLNTLLNLDEFGKFDKPLELASIAFFKNQHRGREDFEIVRSTQDLDLFENTVNDYTKEGKHTILWYVERKTDPSHAQLLLINTIKKEVVMFDPHGGIEAEPNEDIKRIVNRMGYQYVSTAGRCFGNLQEDEQSFAFLCTEGLKTRRTEGFCFAWQLVIANVIIRVPDRSYLEVDMELEEIVHKDPCERLDTITQIIRNISALA